MKLLLDEMYPPAIAKQLRERGHDAEGVTERDELRALSDSAIFALAQHERRTVVTENIADFSVIANEYDQRGQSHDGLVLVAPSSYPRGNLRTIGRMVAALDRLLAAQSESGPRSPRLWL